MTSAIPLRDRSCAPLREGTPKLDAARIAELGREAPEWKAGDDRLARTFVFENFARALAFVNAVGFLAEREDHHPDITMHGWNKVTISTWTHTAHGLSDNDYILAAQIDALLRAPA